MRVVRLFQSALLVAMIASALAAASAQDEKPAKYPLRLHLLAIDDTHPTSRLQPNWCSSSIPAMDGDMGGLINGSAGVQQVSPCGNGNGGFTTFGSPDDFSGGGRADLITPPTGAQALSFTYEGCPRVRVPPGFQGLPARWKKPGKLEVLIPSDSISTSDNSLPTHKCTLRTALHEFVYIRLPNGTILQVAQEAYMRKPALRVFLSGGSATLQPRVSPTVSVKQLVKPPQ